MRVLVAGASGFLGLSAVRALGAGGHEVRGLVRSQAKGGAVAQAGGTPVVGDILNPAGLARAAEGCDALVHAARSTSTAPGMGQSLSAKVRLDGSYNLVAAARAVKARRLLVISGIWLHGSRTEVITEATPAKPIGSSLFNYQAERAALEANKPGALEVVVVRPGMVYGDGGWFREMVDGIKAGTYRVQGDGSNRWSPLHIDDCGDAVRTVLEKGKAGEAYIAVDDEPTPLRDFVGLIAETLNRPMPPALAPVEAIAALGDAPAKLLMADQAASNVKLKGLGWVPRWPRCQEGLPQLLATMR
jgi:nucleoside-diphosphate-sugar epimerase